MHRVPLRRTYISRLTHIQCYKIYESVKKKRYSCILMRGEVFLAWLKAQGGEGGWRTLVGDNMGGGTVQPRPIRFQHVAVWISTGLSLSVTHTRTQKLSLYRRGQAVRAPEVGGSQNFLTIGTWRWQGCQPYTLAAFNPQVLLLLIISFRG